MNGSVRAWTVVDADLLDDLARFNWCLLASKGYVVRNRSVRDGGGLEYLARRVVGLAREDPRIADHINRDKLNNQRSNLRAIARGQNNQNVGSRGGSSRFRGVSWITRDRRWVAGATCNGKRIVAYFDDELEAAAFAVEARRQILPFAVDP
jgi:hypothetical protein